MRARRHIILVGLPGSGKSTVGPLVAKALGAPFADLDSAIAARTGKAIAEIFAQSGEAHFRRLEREEMERALAGPPAVIAPGGGWAAQPGNLDAASAKALTIYLRIDPAQAALRASAPAMADARPLLQGRDPHHAMEDLLQAREASYARCDVTVDAGTSTPQEVAQKVINLARSQGGWY